MKNWEISRDLVRFFKTILIHWHALNTFELALKTITAELPPDGKIAASACAKLTPKLLGQIESVSKYCFFFMSWLIPWTAYNTSRSAHWNTVYSFNPNQQISESHLGHKLFYSSTQSSGPCSFSSTPCCQKTCHCYALSIHSDLSTIFIYWFVEDERHPQSYPLCQSWQTKDNRSVSGCSGTTLSGPAGTGP